MESSSSTRPVSTSLRRKLRDTPRVLTSTSGFGNGSSAARSVPVEESEERDASCFEIRLPCATCIHGTQGREQSVIHAGMAGLFDDNVNIVDCATLGTPWLESYNVQEINAVPWAWVLHRWTSCQRPSVQVDNSAFGKNGSCINRPSEEQRARPDLL